MGKVYDFSNFKIGYAKRPYNTLNNEYELSAHRGCNDWLLASHRVAQIVAVADDKDIQIQHYNFVTIADVAKTEPKKTVDVLAIVEVVPISATHP